jgi:hypothetical protein
LPGGIDEPVERRQHHMQRLSSCEALSRLAILGLRHARPPSRASIPPAHPHDGVVEWIAGSGPAMTEGDGIAPFGLTCRSASIRGEPR